MLGGVLSRANRSGQVPTYVIKGGVALELRLRERARATKDMDLSVGAPAAELVAHFEETIAEPYEGFRFRRRGEAHVMLNTAVRIDVSVLFHDAPWSAIQVDLAAHEGPGMQVDLVDAMPISRLGLNGPDQLPCLALPYHIAQKIHAMTQPRGDDRRPNDRFRDLVDLLLLAPLVEDYGGVRAACDAVFTIRGTHPWPGGRVVVPPEWSEPYTALAESVGGVSTDFALAIREVESFLARIDATR
ncbi:MAG: nucleotidyl transferase AbiEii/AbiGii toxin family protein [Gemmatimonadaceae bacterium]